MERNLGEGDVPYCQPRHGRQVRKNRVGDAAEERMERLRLYSLQTNAIGGFDKLRHRELRGLREYKSGVEHVNCEKIWGNKTTNKTF